MSLTQTPSFPLSDRLLLTIRTFNSWLVNYSAQTPTIIKTRHCHMKDCLNTSLRFRLAKDDSRQVDPLCLEARNPDLAVGWFSFIQICLFFVFFVPYWLIQSWRFASFSSISEAYVQLDPHEFQLYKTPAEITYTLLGCLIPWCYCFIVTYVYI